MYILIYMSSPPDFRLAAECLAILSHPLRLTILWHLLRKELTVGELAEYLGTSSQITSQHLRLMERCRFLKRDQRGKNVYYQVADPCIPELMGCIERHSPNHTNKKRKEK
jgi:ArsR family transcriptional regulator, zinc-responsive transcriptional repressor